MSYKNLTSAEEAEILRDFAQGGLGRLKEDLKQNFFTRISQDIADLFRDQLEKETGGNTSGNLKSSIIPLLDRDGFTIEADFYYKFIDEGVNAAGTQASPGKRLQTSSPYSFKSLSVPSKMARSIRQNYGVAIDAAYAIGVSIKKHGIENKNITDKVMTDALLEEISEDLSTMLGLAVEVSFDKLDDNTQ